jgi:hypothetical protein
MEIVLEEEGVDQGVGKKGHHTTYRRVGAMEMRVAR